MVRTVHHFKLYFWHPYTLFTIRLLNTARRLDWLLASARFGTREATAKLMVSVARLPFCLIIVKNFFKLKYFLFRT
jgi:hypothetical protein